mmetsp:Transcript_19285/g.21766  ORF Transcript_19285/g.21766 Transcript_19285/m.21766 type:complete len:244 (-) Transcript_19285:96-827(-)
MLLLLLPMERLVVPLHILRCSTTVPTSRQSFRRVLRHYCWYSSIPLESNRECAPLERHFLPLVCISSVPPPGRNNGLFAWIRRLVSISLPKRDKRSCSFQIRGFARTQVIAQFHQSIFQVSRRCIFRSLLLLHLLRLVLSESAADLETIPKASNQTTPTEMSIGRSADREMIFQSCRNRGLDQFSCGSGGVDCFGRCWGCRQHRGSIDLVVVVAPLVVVDCEVWKREKMIPNENRNRYVYLLR